MRFLHLIIAALLLASSVTASACHGVGDVHVICKDGEVAALYVEDESAVAAAESPDCCPMVGFALAETNIVPATTDPLETQTTPLPHSAHTIRADAPALPRGPPARLFF